MSMPKLHQYHNRKACYVLTSINDKVVTFQLTPEGERKLSAAGIKPQDRFQRALLLDLYRSGDAYTGGSGVGEQLPQSVNQLELDFAQDPDPETSFPSCEDCAGVEDLHLTITQEQGALAAKLQCATCRDKASAKIDTCIPLRLVSLPLLGRLFDVKDVKTKHDNVTRFENLLRTEFESKWEQVRKLRGTSQESLFGSGSRDELNLTTTKK
jgi:hypothetical protein